MVRTFVILSFLLPLVYLGIPFSASALAAGGESSIAVVVNDEAISAADVAARTKLILVSSGIPDTREMREKMRPQILGTLIDESLMMQEAAQLKIAIKPEDIANGFASIAQQNNMTRDQFMAILKREGIPEKTLAKQIEAQISWNEVVQAKIRPQVVITDNEVDSFLSQIRNDIGKAQYLVSEIFLPVESPRDNADVKQLADNLVRQMTEKNAPFPRIAAQFSQTAGAARGGDIGWVREGELQEDLDAALAKMKEGELSKPIRSLTGYHILLVRRKSVMAEDALPSREDIYNKLGLEQLERLQRRYLLNLKSAAFIENRV